MTAYRIEAARSLDYVIHVGWAAPSYFWQLWEPAGDGLANAGDEPTLDCLVARTHHLVDWRREGAVLRALATDPWLQSATDRRDWDTIAVIVAALEPEAPA